MKKVIKKINIRKKTALICTWLFLMAGAGSWVYGGTVYSGIIKSVNNVNSVDFVYKGKTIKITIAGIDISTNKSANQGAIKYIESLIRGNIPALIRVRNMENNTSMQADLYVIDKKKGNINIGLELIRKGFVKKQSGFDYKYGQLAKAESEAKKSKIGIWAN
ncbi:MAG: thermonuclease family protein [Spirochaetia bacterium]|nr:thermonuclease family protein [Spirochaetia bacterium]